MFLFILFDLTNFDNKFVNRSTVHIDVKNLSSKYTKQLFTKLRLYYLQSYKFLNKEKYLKRWGIESVDERNLLEEEIFIPSIKRNFSENLYQISDYEISIIGSEYDIFLQDFRINLINNSTVIKLNWI